MTVLIVDDNAGIRRLLRIAIAELRAEVSECTDGAYALDMWMAYRPDIVLMDIRMPLVDGLASTRQILSRCPSAKIVVVTDYEDEVMRTASRESGACGYIAKRNLLELAPLLRSLAEV